MRHNLISHKNRKKWYSINLSKVNWNYRNMGIWRWYQESQVQERIRHIKLRKGYYALSSGAHKREDTELCNANGTYLVCMSKNWWPDYSWLSLEFLLSIILLSHRPLELSSICLASHPSERLSLYLPVPSSEPVLLFAFRASMVQHLVSGLSVFTPWLYSSSRHGVSSRPQPYSWRGSTSLSVSQLQPLRLFWNFLKSAEFS